MFPVDGLILVGAVLMLFAIASSKFSARLGLPVLVIFIALGILAGSEGIGGIEWAKKGGRTALTSIEGCPAGALPRDLIAHVEPFASTLPERPV